MTENSTALSTQAAPVKAPVKAGGAIAAFVPQTIEEAFRLSQALAAAGDMIPKAFQDKPQMIMAAIMKGSEVGLAPMQALANIAVINGRPTIWGDAIPALVMRSGHHVDVEITGEGEGLTATATLTRGDTGRKVVRSFSMADAKRAGLAGKPGPWQQYPTRMLSARARTFAVRDGAPDALMGLEVSEEVQNYGPDNARDVTPAAPRRGGAVYRTPDPAPAVDEIHEGEVVEPADPFAGDEEALRAAAFAKSDAIAAAMEDEGAA